MSPVDDKITEAIQVLKALGFPRQQLNDRSALCLLALLDLRPGRSWSDAESPLIGITPIMDWAKAHYARDYAPNTRETFRRQSMHQFVEAGLALYNPDNPGRAVNSPKAVYQIEPSAVATLKTFGSSDWEAALATYLGGRQTLTERYAHQRARSMVPVTLPDGAVIDLSPGRHSELIKAIIESFAPIFAPGARLLYAGDTGDKWGFVDTVGFVSHGIEPDLHGKMPDVVLFDEARGWLILVESVTSHGPVDGKRHIELQRLFEPCGLGLVYVTAFPDRPTMARYMGTIAWETEVWTADSPTHLIHFNGERFLGPYEK